MGKESKGALEDLVAAAAPGASVRRARPLGNLVRSEVFDKCHARFVEEAIAQDIRSVELSETLTHRVLLLAGFVRYRSNKATHAITCEQRVAIGRDDWRPAPMGMIKLIGEKSQWRGLVIDAWARRMEAYLPAKIDEKTFFAPRPVDPSGYDFDPRSFREKLQSALYLAAKRRASASMAQVHVAMVSRAFWHHLLDRERVALAQAYFGPRMTLAHYGIAVRHFGPLSQLRAETPNLTPVMGVALHEAPTSIPRDLLVQARAGCFQTAQADAGSPATDLSPQAWRFLARASRGLVQMVVHNRPGHERYDTAAEASAGLFGDAQYGERCDPRRKGFLQTLNALAAVGTPLPFSFVRWALRSNLSGLAESEPGAMQQFIALAGRQSVREASAGTLKAFIATDLLLVFDYMRRAGGLEANLLHARQLQAVPRNATWASLMRAQRAWHAEAAQRQAAQRARDEAAQRAEDAIEWPSHLGACVVDGLQVTALTSGAALRAEGAPDAMSHCVRDRFSDCVAGHSRIFHLEDPTGKETPATLELSRRWTGSSQWGIGQVFGYDNTPVSPAVRTASKKVLRAYMKAERKAQAAA